MTLPNFPVDPLTLDMVEASLDYCLRIDSYGQPVPVDPGVVSLHELCAFLSGTATDPLGQVQSVSENVSYDPRPTYHPDDIIRALINEVRRLRSEDDRV